MQTTRAQLQILNGPQAGQVVTLETPMFLIGRGSACNLVIADKSVSRRHAQIINQQGTFVIQDMQSLSGTIVNGMRIVNSPLNHGDVINIRGLEIEFRQVAEMSPAAYMPPPPVPLGGGYEPSPMTPSSGPSPPPPIQQAPSPYSPAPAPASWGAGAAAGGAAAGSASTASVLVFLVIICVIVGAVYVVVIEGGLGSDGGDNGGSGGGVVATPIRNVGGTEIGTGDVQITLIWSTSSDVDLHVIDPDGEEIYYADPRSSSGGWLDVDIIPDCNDDSQHVENVFWPTGQAPSGRYRVRVHLFSSICETPPIPVHVIVHYDGRSYEYNLELRSYDQMLDVTTFSR